MFSFIDYCHLFWNFSPLFEQMTLKPLLLISRWVLTASHQAPAPAAASTCSSLVFTSPGGREEWFPHCPASCVFVPLRAFKTPGLETAASSPNGLGSDTDWQYLIFPLVLKSIRSRLKQILTLSEPDLPTTLFPHSPTQDRDLKSTRGCNHFGPNMCSPPFPSSVPPLHLKLLGKALGLEWLQGMVPWVRNLS